ncbi:MAG TPA: [protein-PII] uridylyltransferase, partial [Afifellaceae bacterium]|nr:[protein-PII] uridylyltransferase [Afifellaceae bacterium]
MASPVGRDALAAEFNAIAEKYDAASDKARAAVLDLLKKTMADGREAVRAQLEADGKGRACAGRISALQDVIIQSLFAFATERVFPAANPSEAEKICLAAVGGYGRGMMAPGSDVDLLFLFPYKPTPWLENITEYVLYMLWDLGLKVGHGTRSVSECMRMAKADMTIRTTLLESRFICGNRELFDGLVNRFDKEIMAGTAREFIAAKLAERDARHARSGASRYLVEPQVKDGKGGLRDLQTLYWIARYYYRVSPTQPTAGQALVNAGLLTHAEYRQFRKCHDFLWAVRCHLHFLTGRAEERLTFDLQPELTRRLGYQKHPGLQAVERFMKHYFINAKTVGDLTRIVCAALEEREAKNAPRLNRLFRGLRTRKRKLAGSTDFIVDTNRITVADDKVFERDPVNLIRIFRLAGQANLAFHPDAMRLITKSLKLITRPVQNDPVANKLFVEILTAPTNSELVLRRMNETGVLGRFIPDFGKVVSMMQFNMYHHYTVDEHLLQAVGVLAEMDRGGLKEEHPLSHEILPDIKDKTVLYVALFLHDIAKGRPEDHSLAGARIARRLCPRFGLTPQQTETVAWLVEQHLTMSIIAQSRDLADRRTIMDFGKIVQSLDRMRLLIVLTVCDIRAVGPGVWNGWKGQLLRTLYYACEPILTGGFSKVTRDQQVKAAQAALSDRLGDWKKSERKKLIDLHYPAYWLRAGLDDQVRHAELIAKAGQADKSGRGFAYDIRPMKFEGATEIAILTPDHPRLLSIMAGACSAVGANIVDAQIYTTTDGRALDAIIISRAFDKDSDETRRGERIAALIEQALVGKVRLPEAMARRRKATPRRDAFSVEPQVKIENE